MSAPQQQFTFKPLTLAEIDEVPLDCQGPRTELVERIRTLGAGAILALDQGLHVGQVQFRQHDPDRRSAEGIWSSDYWGDFADLVDPLPSRTLGIFCYHVGQTEPGDKRDAAYSGKGMATGLLDHLLMWASRNAFDAVVAKGVPANPATMAFMGGLPLATYQARGFRCEATYQDPQLREALRERSILVGDDDPRAYSIGICVKFLA